MRYALAIFDLDGTIVDTRRPITMSVNRTLEEAGHARREVAEIEQWIGLPLGEVLRRAAGLPEGRTASRQCGIATARCSRRCEGGTGFICRGDSREAEIARLARCGRVRRSSK